MLCQPLTIQERKSLHRGIFQQSTWKENVQLFICLSEFWKINLRKDWITLWGHTNELAFKELISVIKWQYRVIRMKRCQFWCICLKGLNFGFWPIWVEIMFLLWLSPQFALVTSCLGPLSFSSWIYEWRSMVTSPWWYKEDISALAHVSWVIWGQKEIWEDFKLSRSF